MFNTNRCSTKHRKPKTQMRENIKKKLILSKLDYSELSLDFFPEIPMNK